MNNKIVVKNKSSSYRINWSSRITKSSNKIFDINLILESNGNK
jgi:hypothetical protein